MRLDPFHSKSIPPGPIFMPQYKNANELATNRFEDEAAKHFNSALKSRDVGDNYVRVTVLLATVLFLTALAQRFEYKGPRVVMVVIAGVLLVCSLFWLTTLPRA
jgi:hypothetical protein